MSNEGNNEERLSTAQVAKLAGVHRDTVLRWLRTGLVSEPRRDRNGWRCFTEQEATAIVSFADGTARAVDEPETLSSPAQKPEAIQHLHQIDWDFRDAKTDYLTHPIHPYPAKYIPQIPNALIQELSVTGEVEFKLDGSLVIGEKTSCCHVVRPYVGDRPPSRISEQIDLRMEGGCCIGKREKLIRIVKQDF